MKNLLASLGDHSLAMLRGIADLRGILLLSNVREEAAAQMAEALTLPGATEAAVAALSVEARAAWSDLLAAGGEMKVPALTRRYGTIRPVGPGKLEREMSWRQPAGPAEELWYWGLIFRAFADLGGGPLEYFYIPDELRPPVSAGAPQAASAALTALEPVAAPPTFRRAFNSLAVDACATLAALSAAPWRVANSGRWRSADQAQLSESLLLPDPARIALLVALAQDLGWLAVAEGRLVVQAGPATAWLRQAAWEQASGLFRAWESSAGWNDLRHVASLRAEGVWRNDPLTARRALLAALARLDPGAWYALPALVAHIKQADPDFQRPDGNYAGWYLRDAASGRYLSGFESWDDVEGRLIGFLVEGPLFWLGAVHVCPGQDAAAAAGDGAESAPPTRFSLTPAGAHWIAARPAPPPPAPARLLVDEQFTVTAPLWVPLYDRFRLLRFSERAAAPYELGQPTLHRISRHSLASARTRGLEGEKIAQFLKRATGDRLPARVEAGLLRWDQHGGAVRISKGAVVRVEDAATLSSLRADPQVAPLLDELLSAQAVLVRETHLPRLLAVLAELGYSARVD